MNHAVYFLVFACVGVSVEVFFTALADARHKIDAKLQGRSYIWMFPIFGLTYPVLLLGQRHLGTVSLPLRALTYVLLLYLLEYSSGWLIRKLTGICPWEDMYHGSRWSVHDLIRIDYAPAWFIFVLLLERLYIFLL